MMNNSRISTDHSFLNVELPESLTTSPSVSTFMPDEDASICPLLPNTSPSPPLDFTHPLTPSTQNDGISDAPDDPAAETSSSSSSGIGMSGNSNGNNIFNHTPGAYKHLLKNGDHHSQDNGKLDYLNSLNVPTKEMPDFVMWNWPLIRKATFMVFCSGIFAMFAICLAMIYNLPRICNPEVVWYKGSVFYEIFPASFKDSNNDGIGDLRGLASQVDYLQNMSIRAVRLNSIFQSKHYPEHYQDVENLLEIDLVLGTIIDFDNLVAVLHDKNINLILDLPVYPFFGRLQPSTLSNDSLLNESSSSSAAEYRRVERSIIGDDNTISDAMRYWLSKGVDGFYVKGLEHFSEDPYLMENLREWKYLLGPDRVIIVHKALIEKAESIEVVDELLDSIDLVDVFLNVSNGTKHIADQVKELLEGQLRPSTNGPWIHWTINGVNERRVASGVSPNASLAAILLQLMLPGTPSIFYGDEVSLEEATDIHREHQETKHMFHLPTMSWDGKHFTSKTALPWLPKSASVSYNHLEYVVSMIELRKRSPGIYKNSVCKDGNDLMNLNIRSNQDDLLIIERTYPRRNSHLAIINLGNLKLSLDLSAMFYSGELVLGPSMGSTVYFSRFEIGCLETIVVKLSK